MQSGFMASEIVKQYNSCQSHSTISHAFFRFLGKISSLQIYIPELILFIVKNYTDFFQEMPVTARFLKNIGIVFCRYK